MKKILITQRLMTNTTYHEIREGLDINWSRLLFDLGFLPIVLPIGINFEEYFNTMKIDGILLTGGNDISRFSEDELSFKRDSLEKNLIGFAIKNDISLYGVCRGMQIIADFFGSTFKKIDMHINVKHKLRINEESKYSKYLKELTEVNSFHSFAINKPSSDLLISAYSNDDIIEAIEHKRYKIFGQMWHSERENPFKDEELKLMKGFFK
ncbi:MAG: gamma-glutamyl-gamma-aminobutyrate hydrolase family protein [Arcobacter sp.]|uniref:gamma-glutamyl-gamma-aminobutyrate hydrolase family protein n=1 Tax=Arcobacter sp. TaxID=1872629 RepID=UPI003C73B64F